MSDYFKSCSNLIPQEQDIEFVLSSINKAANPNIRTFWNSNQVADLDIIKNAEIDPAETPNTFYNFYLFMFPLLYKNGIAYGCGKDAVNKAYPGNDPQNPLKTLCQKRQKHVILFLYLLSSQISIIDTKDDLISKLIDLVPFLPSHLIANQMISLFFCQETVRYTRYKDGREDKPLFELFLVEASKEFRKKGKTNQQIADFFVSKLEKDFFRKAKLVDACLSILMDAFPQEVFESVVNRFKAPFKIIYFFDSIFPHPKCPNPNEQQLVTISDFFLSYQFSIQSSFFKHFFARIKKEEKAAFSVENEASFKDKLIYLFKKSSRKDFQQTTFAKINEKISNQKLVHPCFIELFFDKLEPQTLENILIFSRDSPHFISFFNLFLNNYQSTGNSKILKILFNLAIDIPFPSNSLYLRFFTFKPEFNFESQIVQLPVSSFPDLSNPFFNSTNYFMKSFYTCKNQFILNFPFPNFTFSKIYLFPPELPQKCFGIVFDNKTSFHSSHLDDALKKNVSLDHQFQTQMIPQAPNPFKYNSFQEFHQHFVHWICYSARICIDSIPHPKTLSTFNSSLHCQNRPDVPQSNVSPFCPSKTSKPSINSRIRGQVDPQACEKFLLEVNQDFQTLFSDFQTPFCESPTEYFPIGVEKDAFRGSLMSGKTYYGYQHKLLEISSFFNSDIVQSEVSMNKFLNEEFNQPDDLLFLIQQKFSIQVFNKVVNRNPRLITKIQDSFEIGLRPSLLVHFIQNVTSFESAQYLYFASYFLDILFIHPNSREMIFYYCKPNNIYDFYLFVKLILVRSHKKILLFDCPSSTIKNSHRIWQFHLISVLIQTTFCQNKPHIYHEVRRQFFVVQDELYSDFSESIVEILNPILNNTEEKEIALCFLKMIFTFYRSFDLKRIFLQNQVHDLVSFLLQNDPQVLFLNVGCENHEISQIVQCFEANSLSSNNPNLISFMNFCKKFLTES